MMNKRIDIMKLMYGILHGRNTSGFESAKKQKELRAQLRKERVQLLSFAEDFRVDAEVFSSKEDRLEALSSKELFEDEADVRLNLLREGAPACVSRTKRANELKKALKERDESVFCVPLKEFLKQKRKENFKKVLLQKGRE